MPRLSYRHPHNPTHMPAHVLSALVGPTLTLPVDNARLVLGTWQRVVLVEADGPQERRIVMTFASEG